MNFIQSVVGRITGVGGSSEVTSIEGKFYLVRRPGIRSYGKECIFIDCLLSIRKTSHEFQTELVVTRMWNEGEQDLLEEEDENEDERVFLIDQTLHFAVAAQTAEELREDDDDAPSTTFTWDNLDDSEAYYAFVCDTKARADTIRNFESFMYRAMYERKYTKSANTATPADLAQFKPRARQPDKPSFTAARSPPPQTRQSPVQKPLFRPPSPETDEEQEVEEDDEIAEQLTSGLSQMGLSVAQPTASTSKAVSRTRQFSEEPVERDTSYLDPVSLPTEPKTLVTSQTAELYLYDTATGTFMLQAKGAEVSVWVVEKQQRTLWLTIVEKQTKATHPWVSMGLDGSLNLTFSEAQMCLVFPYTHEQTERVYTWLIRCATKEDYNALNVAVSRHMFELDSGARFEKMTPAERQYAQDVYVQDDIEMSGPGEDEFEDAEEQEQAESDDEEAVDTSYDAPDSGSDGEAAASRPPAGKNSQLAVGHKENLSFVVRGNMIGVFRTGDRGSKRLKFVANINNLTTPDGKRSFAPSKIMLHEQDKSMVLRDPLNPSSLYSLDLETGKVVEEYKIGLDVVNFLPDSKFAPTTAQKTFTGHSHNALFRIDPRLSGSKLIESEYKQYVSKNEFSAAATTEKGGIAVASAKGDIRLFDSIGKNAKTALPAFGQAITGIDVSKDGRWVVATTDTFLLLIDTTIEEGRYAGSSGFDRSFPAAAKPKPKRLTLRPEHAAYMQGKLKFTTAKFNTGPDAVEKAIVTSSGPFVIAFNFKKVREGHLDSYTIKRYDEQVVADGFRFNDNKDIVVTLANNIFMEQRNRLEKPNRDSLGGIVRQF